MPVQADGMRDSSCATTNQPRSRPVRRGLAANGRITNCQNRPSPSRKLPLAWARSVVPLALGRVVLAGSGSRIPTRARAPPVAWKMLPSADSTSTSTSSAVD